MSILHLTEQEATDLRWAIHDMVNAKVEQLADIGKDHPFSNPIERDEIKSDLQREIDVAHNVLTVIEEGVA